MIDLEPYLPAITKEARRLRHVLPTGHPIELQDLVAAGVAHSLEFLRFDGVPSPALVRANARQGMLAEIRRWDHGTRYTPVSASSFEQFDATTEWKLRRCTPAPPMELMIDLGRELLRVRLVDAFAWVTCRLHEDPYDAAASELGYSRDSIRNCVGRAATALQDALAEYDHAARRTPFEIAAKLFREGRSLKEVATRVHMGDWRLRAVQDAVDPDARERRAQFVAQRTVLRPDVEEIVRLRRSGLTHQKIADRLGCSQSSVSRIMRRNGLRDGRIDAWKNRNRLAA